MSDEAQKNSPASVGEGVDGARGSICSAEVPAVAEEQKPASGKRVYGQNLLGITYIAPDFDAPMSEEDLKEWGY